MINMVPVLKPDISSTNLKMIAKWKHYG